MRKMLVSLVVVLPLAGQSSLSLMEAVRQALDNHPSIAASRDATKGAEMRIAEARSGYLPKLNYTESALRTNNPVVVFSSLLTQHQFTAANFALGPLNRPAALDNFQSQLALDQTVYDGGETRLGVRTAKLGRDVSAEDERLARMIAIANVVRAYHGAVLAAESARVAGEALRSAEADLNRAQAVREAGMSTNADVLSIRVHLAAVREEQIRRKADLAVAQAALNEALGLPLTEPHDLSTPLTAAAFDQHSLEQYETAAGVSRPELHQARMASDLARTQGSAARALLLPQVGVHAGFEADRQTFTDRGGASWLVSASLRWNIFNGGADRARMNEAAYSLDRARALERQASSQIRLQVRRAYADFKAAAERIDVAQAAVSMAEESLRITKNRYDSGLSNVTDLLRTETALLEARNRRLAAIYDQRLAAVSLELAAGTLTDRSEVLN
jgi:outer membrane protein TolC